MKYWLLPLLLISTCALCWDGFDYDSGEYIQIDEGNLVRSGNEIQYFDYGDGEYKSGEVQSIQRYGNSVDVEVLDSETGDYRTFTMDD